MISKLLTKKEVKVLLYLYKNGKRSIYRTALDLGMSFSGVHYILKKFRELGILDKSNKLTEIGKKIAEQILSNASKEELNIKNSSMSICTNLKLLKTLT